MLSTCLTVARRITSQRKATITLLLGCLWILEIGPTRVLATGNELATHPQEHATCNKVLCAPVVSYCLIQELCSCNAAEDCSCCAECATCLGDLYRHCCDCVGMRKSSNYTTDLPTLVSTVGTFENPNENLYHALTERDMTALSCTIVRFPKLEELTSPNHGHLHSRRHHNHHKDELHTEDERTDPQNYLEDVQVVLRQTYDFEALCTAVYFNSCMPLKECVMSCETMGATSYRWFHNGCCECVGHTCLTHGNKYPKCSECLQ